MSSAIIGISAFYHDSAACLLIDGKIIAAAQEERFTRIKYDSSFPINAIKYVLEEGGLDLKNIELIAFYDKPFIKFERLLETYHAFAPKGIISFLSAIPVWIKEKLFMKKIIYDGLAKISNYKPKIIFPEHHLSHAASAFYPSPFNDAAILTIDGVGEWATATIGLGKDNNITILRELSFPHSIGLLYSAFTYYCGFKVNSGEYKLMGLAPYGFKDNQQTLDFKKKILENIVNIKDDGSIILNMKYFNYATGLRMCNEKKWEELFGIPKREQETELTENYMNLALAIQQILEDIFLKLARTTKKITNMKNIVLAGGVALNCVANGKLLRSGIFDDIWIQPAAGDAGGALGAAFVGWHIWKNKKRKIEKNRDKMMGSYLGPEYSDMEIKKLINKYNAKYLFFNNFEKLCEKTSELIAKGNVIGWFQGRMEFGPRALGNRSIIADARNPEMQKKLNLKIKYREGFRPFAPSVLEENIKDYFELDRPSPYMLIVAQVKKNRTKPYPESFKTKALKERLYFIRSDIPAITHIDYSARIHSVNKDTNEKYWKLIKSFKNKTKYGVIVNTSFNVRGEPIVCNPEEAYLCFMRTEMDYLIINNYLFDKKIQDKLTNDEDWKKKYKLD